jgi:hypothetical protein
VAVLAVQQLPVLKVVMAVVAVSIERLQMFR